AASGLQRPGIEDVVIADTVFKEETFVIAGSRHGFIDGLQRRKYRPAGPGMLNADRPGSAIGTPSEDPKVSGDGDQTSRRASVSHHGRRAFGGIALADAADVDLHSGFFQEDRSRL